MSEKKVLYVKPARPGLCVKIPGAPARSYLPPEGGAVANNSYWRRRLRKGDVVETTEKEVAAARKKAHDAVQAKAEKAKTAPPAAKDEGGS